MIIKNIPLPDIGDFDAVEIIEVLVSVGDEISAESSILTLESDKAAMEIPAPEAGIVHECLVKVGDKVSTGDIIMRFSINDEASSDSADKDKNVATLTDLPESKTQTPTTQEQVKQAPSELVQIDNSLSQSTHAGPAVRHFARELGAELNKIKGTGQKGRILLEDVKAHVKQQLNKPKSANTGTGGLNIADSVPIDFSDFGEIATQKFSRIKKLSGAALHRNWVTIPHVTQFDEADITELEKFRKSLKPQAEAQGLKLTPMPILIKAVIATLKAFPAINASINPAVDGLILKKYFHIGFAVDTPDGLLVPVIRNADQLGLFELAREISVLSEKARTGKLGLKDMQGGCFTISSLGGIGGTAFTPIINAPELAILGVSRSQIKPIYDSASDTFIPRLILPLSLSYDHRAIDGALAVRFTSYLSFVLTDVRRLLL